MPGYDASDQALWRAIWQRMSNGKSEAEALKFIEDGWGVRIEHIGKD